MKKTIFTPFYLLLVFFSSKASTPGGGQVTYLFLGNNKFEVTLRVYRDCTGFPFNISSYTIKCQSTSVTKNLIANRISVTDISAVCNSVKKPCNPSTFSSFGTELHIYKDTLDFNGSESAFKSCCIIQIGVGICCRTPGITTGASGENFWVHSTLDLCRAPTNSSPVFRFNPFFTESIGQPSFRSYFAQDTIDNDSLSYSFTDPLKNFTIKTSWGSGYDSKNPFTPYYPSGYNKNNGPKPDVTPPIGIYLDPQSGNLIGTPVVQSEYSIIAISVKEWRKDSTGKYNQIGEIVIDHAFQLRSEYNNSPSIGAKSTYKVCEGQPFSLDITTYDRPYVPPSPGAPILNDTVWLDWDKNIKNAKFSILNPNVKLPVGKFEWTPATGDSKKGPYFFSIIAKDNNCPIQAESVKTIKLLVFPKITTNSTVNKISNAIYFAGLDINNKSYNYSMSKNIVSDIPANPKNYYFKSTNSTYSNSQNDTLVFKRNGIYILSQIFNSETECNSTVFNDTISISNLPEVKLENNTPGIYTDTSLCRNQPSSLFAKVANVTFPVTYFWKTKNKTQVDTLGYFTNAFASDDTVFVRIKDAAGQTDSTYRVVTVLDIPIISAGPDKSICPGETLFINANLNRSKGITWEWFSGSNKFSSIDSVALSTPGIYRVIATHSNGCLVQDTMELNYYKVLKIDLISGEYCQDKNHLVQSEIFKENPNLLFKSINWTLLKTLPRPAGGSNGLGDLLVDLDSGPAFNFKIFFDDSKVLILLNLKDSFILRADALDTNGCKSTDNLNLTIIKKPEIKLLSKNMDACINNSIDLALNGSTSGKHQWVPFYRSGFGVWPSYLPLEGDTIGGSFFKAPGKYKIKLEANVQNCFNTDSLLININPIPKAIVSLQINNQTVRFKDNTPDILSRKWFINNSLFSEADTLLANKSIINLQPVKLELTDKNGCIGDTIIFLTLGIDKIKQGEVTVFPNPANTFLILRQKGNDMGAIFEIFDVLGKIVHSGIMRTKEERIDLHDIKPGIYYLKYNTGLNVFSVPFIRSE